MRYLILVALVGIFAYMIFASQPSRDEVLLRDAERNLYTVQGCLEEYGKVHDGHFPPTMVGFPWDRYLAQLRPDYLRSMVNPYDETIHGDKLVEASIPIHSPGPASDPASHDRRPFTTAGAIRYYVNADRTRYALVGSKQDRLPIGDGPLGSGEVNYVVAN